MDQSNAMKKILILGANTETIPLIQTAQKMGVFVIVTDNVATSPAKKYADKAMNIDGKDLDSIVKFCRAEGIDTVLVGVADKLVQTYSKVCDTLGINSYINLSAASVLSNKRLFDEYCLSYGLKSIPKIELPIADQKIYDDGILLKPSDGCSGKGIYVARSQEELERYMPLSKEHSLSGDILLERCMTGDELFAYFSIVDGEVYLSGIADKLTNKTQGITGKVILNSIYPSKYAKLFYDTQYEKINLLIKSLNVQTGLFMISAFVKDNEFYLYDPGSRLQGEGPDVILKHFYGFDHKEMLINYALGQNDYFPPNINQNDYMLDGNHAATVWLLGKAGVIDKIIGLENIIDKFGVYHYLQRLYPTDTITEAMVKTEAQVIARIYTQANTKEKLDKNIRNIRNHIKVLDTNSEDMLIYE